MKRILYVEQNTDGTIGGSHYTLLYLIQNLPKNDYKPIIFFYESNDLINLFEKEGKIVIRNLKGYIYGSKTISKVLNIILYIKYLAYCIWFLNSKKINLIHLNNAVFGGYDTWLFAAKLLRISCITHERGYKDYNIWKKSILFRLLAYRYDKILAVSNVIRNNLIGHGFNENQVITVYDGIDIKKYISKVRKTPTAIRNELGIDKEAFVIGMIGNIRRKKGQEYLIECMNIVNKEFKNFICLLVGDISKNNKDDEEYFKTIETKINKYKLTDKIIFTGYRNNVPELINMFDLQINASITPDPFPHVILEGMSLGKPIIATNLGGAIESVEDGHTGYLIKAYDVNTFSEKVLYLINNPIVLNNFSRQAKKQIEKFSLNKNVSNILNIYEKL